MKSPLTARHFPFDATPEIFATNGQGGFTFALTVDGEAVIHTAPFDELRLTVSIWYPGRERSIELDRAYVELRGSLDPRDEHWTKLAEIEPVVPPYGADSFDGWLVLPVLAADSSFQLSGSGFEPRTRLQLRASAYLVT